MFNMSLEMSTFEKSRKNTLKTKPLSSNHTDHDRVSATLNFSFACAEKLYFTGIYRSSVLGVFFVKKGTHRLIDRVVILLQGFYLFVAFVALLKLQTSEPPVTGQQIDKADSFLLKFVSYSYLAACALFWTNKATCSYFDNDAVCMLNSLFLLKKRQCKGKVIRDKCHFTDLIIY